MAIAIAMADANVIIPPIGPHMSRIFLLLLKSNTASPVIKGVKRLIAKTNCKLPIYLAPISALAAFIPYEETPVLYIPKVIIVKTNNQREIQATTGSFSIFNGCNGS